MIACKCRGLDQTDKDAPLNLLAVEFAERDAPAGTVTLTFSGGGAIRLEVECLEAELVDLGEVFAAATCPDHFADGEDRLTVVHAACWPRRRRAAAKSFISTAMTPSVAA